MSERHHAKPVYLGTAAERAVTSLTTDAEGVQWWETDADALYVWTGSAWTAVAGSGGTWQDWTPTVDQSGAVAATVDYARYVLHGDTAHLQAYLTMTGAGAVSNDISIGGMPVAARPANTGGIAVCGTVVIDDGGTQYQGSVVATTSTALKFVAHNTGAYMGADPDFGLAASDVISFQVTYET